MPTVQDVLTRMTTVASRLTPTEHAALAASQNYYAVHHRLHRTHLTTIQRMAERLAFTNRRLRRITEDVVYACAALVGEQV